MATSRSIKATIPSIPEYPCPDCGAAPGHLHLERGCPLEQCSTCGFWGGCCCSSRGLLRVPWSGHYPGVTECREVGWFIKGRETSVETEGSEDINRLVLAVHDGWVRWDQNWRRFVKGHTVGQAAGTADSTGLD